MESNDNSELFLNFDLESAVKISDGISINYQKILGNGAFGIIYLGFNHKTYSEVAVKMESQKTKTPQLVNESKILKLLQGGIGIPNIYHITAIGEYSVMVMDYLNKNLEQLMTGTIEKKFSLKTVLMIADQIITRIEYIHSKYVIHRDIKPENFLIGFKENKFLLYLIDYGLSTRIINAKNGQHINYSEGKSLIGTARFASINTHMGIEQSRRDDLESLGYLLIYLSSGDLPWQGIKAKTKTEKYNRIMEIKIKTVPNEICKFLPDEFINYFDYCRALEFHETPKYEYLRNLFKKVFHRFQYKYDYIFDWSKEKNKEEDYINGKNIGESDENILDIRKNYLKNDKTKK